MADFQGLENYATEQLTVSTSALGPTTSTVENWQTYDAYEQQGKSTKCAGLLVEVRTNGVYYTTDGSTPSASNGFALNAGDVLPVVGFKKCKNLKMIRSGGADATVMVTYYRA